jgi:hypothetical protein
MKTRLAVGVLLFLSVAGCIGEPHGCPKRLAAGVSPEEPEMRWFYAGEDEPYATSRFAEIAVECYEVRGADSGASPSEVRIAVTATVTSRRRPREEGGSRQGRGITTREDYYWGERNLGASHEDALRFADWAFSTTSDMVFEALSASGVLLGSRRVNISYDQAGRQTVSAGILVAPEAAARITEVRVRWLHSR